MMESDPHHLQKDTEHLGGIWAEKKEKADEGLGHEEKLPS